jgi:hypothetical protein
MFSYAIQTHKPSQGRKKRALVELRSFLSFIFTLAASSPHPKQQAASCNEFRSLANHKQLEVLFVFQTETTLVVVNRIMGFSGSLLF